MNKDTQIIHHLWWLRKFLNTQFRNKDYGEVIYEEIDSDILKELDLLVEHIKANY